MSGHTDTSRQCWQDRFTVHHFLLEWNQQTYSHLDLQTDHQALPTQSNSFHTNTVVFKMNMVVEYGGGNACIQLHSVVQFRVLCKIEKALSINDQSLLSSNDEAPLLFTPECKHLQLQMDLSKCIICQSKIKDKTFHASEKGFLTFQRAARIC